MACGGWHTMVVCRANTEPGSEGDERHRGVKDKVRAWFAGTRAALDLPERCGAGLPWQHTGGALPRRAAGTVLRLQAGHEVVQVL